MAASCRRTSPRSNDQAARREDQEAAQEADELTSSGEMGKTSTAAFEATREWLSEFVMKLEAAGVKPPVGDNGDWNGYGGDPFEFLPKWMTKNPLRTK